jgi:hypothetical protein
MGTAAKKGGIRQVSYMSTYVQLILNIFRKYFDGGKDRKGKKMKIKRFLSIGVAFMVIAALAFTCGSDPASAL